MIIEILNRNYDAIIMQLTIVIIAWVMVVLSVGIDLYFGIKKSKQMGVFTHSYGLRKTSEKTVWYLALMFFMLFIDVLNPVWAYFQKLIPLPLLSIFGAIVLVYTEYKSVREKASEKFRKRIDSNTAELLEIIGRNKKLLDELKKKNENK